MQLCGNQESDDARGMNGKDTGANFQIVVDGKSLSHRDAMETALGACLGNGPRGWFATVHELGGYSEHDLTWLRWRA